MMDFGIAAGVGRIDCEGDLLVYIDIPDMGRVTFEADIARMLAVQLMLNADFIEGKAE